MSLYKHYGVDTEKAQKGVPCTLVANDDETVPTFYVSQIGRTNRKYMALVEKNIQPSRRQYRGGGNKIPAEKILEANKDAFIRSALHGWANVRGPDGKDLTFSVDAAIKLLGDLPNLYFELEAFAEDISNFQTEDREDDVKNS